LQSHSVAHLGNNGKGLGFCAGFTGPDCGSGSAAADSPTAAVKAADTTGCSIDCKRGTCKPVLNSYEYYCECPTGYTGWDCGVTTGSGILTHFTPPPFQPYPIPYYLQASTVYTPLSGVPRFPIPRSANSDSGFAIPRSANSDSPLKHHDLHGKEQLRRRCRAPLKAILRLMALRLKACILWYQC